jgi:hypothetical protein
MAKRPHLSLLAATVLLMATTAAAVQRPTADRRQTDNGPCLYETIDACFHEGDWWYEDTTIVDGLRHNNVQCGLADGCKACGVTSQGKPVCVSILYDASCRCRVEHIPGTGPNIVTCSDEGICEVRQ